MNARVVGLHVRDRKGGPVRPVAEVVGRVGGGLLGDVHAARTKRAVLVVDRSTLDALGLRPGDLREQVTVEGLPGVTALAPETVLRIGGITLRVNGPCEPCTHIGGLLGVDDVEAFRIALEGRRGAVCTVVAAERATRVGDAVDVLGAAAPVP